MYVNFDLLFYGKLNIFSGDITYAHSDINQIKSNKHTDNIMYTHDMKVIFEYQILKFCI